MPTTPPDLTKFTEDQLTKAHWAATQAVQAAKAAAQAVQDELDRRDLEQRLGTLSEAQVEMLRQQIGNVGAIEPPPDAPPA